MNLIKLILIGAVYGHSNMFAPKVRGNMEWWGYCSRGWGCNSACEAPKSNKPPSTDSGDTQVIKRGEFIPVEWFRQNHPGGFVRIAFATYENSDDVKAFDSNPVKYMCYENNCKEDSYDPNLGEMNGSGSSKCASSVKIPDNLPDGPVTLQWTWYGGGVLFADQHASFANYVSCSDMVIKGGNPYKDKKIQPEFEGGDVVSTDKNKCRYWSTNSVFGCPNGSELKDRKCGYGAPLFGAPLEWGQAISNSELKVSNAAKEAPEKRVESNDDGSIDASGESSDLDTPTELIDSNVPSEPFALDNHLESSNVDTLSEPSVTNLPIKSTDSVSMEATFEPPLPQGESDPFNETQLLGNFQTIINSHKCHRKRSLSKY